MEGMSLFPMMLRPKLKKDKYTQKGKSSSKCKSACWCHLVALSHWLQPAGKTRLCTPRFESSVSELAAAYFLFTSSHTEPSLWPWCSTMDSTDSSSPVFSTDEQQWRQCCISVLFTQPHLQSFSFRCIYLKRRGVTYESSHYVLKGCSHSAPLKKGLHLRPHHTNNSATRGTVKGNTLDKTMQV